jgi:hypothetical protein
VGGGLGFSRCTGGSVDLFLPAPRLRVAACRLLLKAVRVRRVPRAAAAAAKQASSAQCCPLPRAGLALTCPLQGPGSLLSLGPGLSRWVQTVHGPGSRPLALLSAFSFQDQDQVLGLAPRHWLPLPHLHRSDLRSWRWNSRHRGGEDFTHGFQLRPAVALVRLEIRSF